MTWAFVADRNGLEGLDVLSFHVIELGTVDE